MVSVRNGRNMWFSTSAACDTPVRSAPGVEYPPVGKIAGKNPTPPARASRTRIPNQNSGMA